MSNVPLNRSESNLRFVRVISFIALVLGLIHAGWPNFGVKLLLVQVFSSLAVLLTIFTHIYGLFSPFRKEYWKERKLELLLFTLVLFWSLSLLLAAYDEKIDSESSALLLKWSLFLLLALPIAFIFTETRFLSKWLFSLQNKFSATFAFTFLLIIFTGSFLLHSPGASANPSESIPYLDALFTSVSASAVTGLSTINIGTQFSPFGKTIIGILILIGGWGPVTLIGLMRILSGERLIYEEKHIGLEIIADVQHRVAPLLKTVLLTTILAVGTGTYLLFQIWPDPSLLPIERLGNALFHSLSAFCNAGLGFYGDSLASVSSEVPRILIVIIGLIVIGGIGFPVILDFVQIEERRTIGHIHSKVTIITTLILILIGSFITYHFTPSVSDQGERFIRAVFRAISPRTAGFSDGDLTQWGWFPLSWITLLMIIGAGPSSTAGGMKVTTLAVGVLRIFGSKKSWVLSTSQRAFGMMLAYVITLLIGFGLICLFEQNFSGQLLFESVSALSTVGLSLDVTPTLERSSQFVIMVLMFLGRIGPLALLDFSRKRASNTDTPPPILIA